MKIYRIIGTTTGLVGLFWIIYTQSGHEERIIMFPGAELEKNTSFVLVAWDKQE